MRRLILLLLLFPAALQAATTDTQFCASVGKYVTAADVCGAGDAKDCCPPNLSNQTSGANLSSTAFDGAVDTDLDEGTLYACARPSGTSKRTCAQIQAGTGCTDTSSKAVSTAGTIVFDSTDNFSGLTASTEYDIDYCHPYDDRPLDEVLDTTPVTTLAGGGGGGEDLTGTGYFVRCDTGNDSNDGLSHANAWLTTAKVNNNVTAQGSNVYFFNGETCEDQSLTVDWNGTAGDPNVIAGYYIETESGDPKHWDEGTATGRGTKPEINGTYEASCRSLAPPDTPDIGTCLVAEAGAVPSSLALGLINIYGGNTTIRNLKVADAAGPAIKAYGAELSSRNNVTIIGVDTIRSLMQGIHVNEHETGSTIIIKDNTVTLAALIGVDGVNSTWPACISVDSGHDAIETMYTLIENNVVDQCGGEGITFLRADGGIMRFNTVSNAQRHSFYFDNANNAIGEHNMSVGQGITGDGATHGYTSWFSAGWANVSEDYSTGSSTTNNIIRNNIIANAQTGPYLDCYTGSACASFVIGAKIVGNTIAQDNNPAYQLWTNNMTAASPDNMDTIQLTNNLILGGSGCTSIQADEDLTVSYNLWEGTPPSACQGTGSAYSGDGGISYDWTGAKSGAIPTEANMTPSNGSDGDDAGTPLTANEFTASDYPQRSEMDTCTPTDQGGDANWSKLLYVDFGCNVRNATTPDMGAIEH